MCDQTLEHVAQRNCEVFVPEDIQHLTLHGSEQPVLTVLALSGGDGLSDLLKYLPTSMVL